MVPNDWLGQLFTAHYDRLCDYARRIGSPDWADEEDTVQDAFANLAERRSALIVAQDTEAVLKYLMKTIRGLVANRRRDNALDESHRTLHADTIQSVAGPSRGSPPDRASTTEEFFAQVDHAVDRLPMRCREIWLLRRMGMSTQDVADALGIRPGTVKVQMANAFKFFRQELAVWIDGETPDIADIVRNRPGESHV